jgi:hypothetical protein
VHVRHCKIYLGHGRNNIVERYEQRVRGFVEQLVVDNPKQRRVPPNGRVWWFKTISQSG